MYKAIGDLHQNQFSRNQSQTSQDFTDQSLNLNYIISGQTLINTDPINIKNEIE